MFKTKKTRLISLVTVAALIVLGAVYTTAAWAMPSRSVVATAAQIVATTDESQPRETILEMLEEHMGLTGTEAEERADQMLSHMQDVAGDYDLEEMIDHCERFMDSDDYDHDHCGPGSEDGMMGGGYGMMGGGHRR